MSASILLPSHETVIWNTVLQQCVISVFIVFRDVPTLLTKMTYIMFEQVQQ
ncbi:MAG: hypothetical protein WCP16_20710 [Pseudanabaena sp. ELA645]